MRAQRAAAAGTEAPRRRRSDPASGVRRTAGIAAAVAALAVAGVAMASGEGSATLGPGPVNVELGIDRSAFSTDHLTVRRGTTVRFVVVNDDPINHELIVGDDELHQRHENGTEAVHPPRPGEVTVGALTTAETSFAFDEPGTFEFACHLPGHLAYGMVGTVTVTR